jgi:hypothetical protein
VAGDYNVYVSANYGTVSGSATIHPQPAPGSSSLDITAPPNGTIVDCKPSASAPMPIVKCSYSWSSHLYGAPSGTYHSYRVIQRIVGGGYTHDEQVTGHSQKSGSYSIYRTCDTYPAGTSYHTGWRYVLQRKRGNVYSYANLTLEPNPPSITVRK